MSFNFFLILFLLGYGLFLSMKWIRSREDKFRLSFIEVFEPTVEAETILSFHLEQLNKLIPFDYGCFYFYQTESAHYMMKMVKKKTDVHSNIEPSYSGLLPYQKVKFQPPLKLTKETVPQHSKVIEMRGTSIVAIPVNEQVLVLLVPSDHSVKKRQLKQLSEIAGIMNITLNTYL